LTIEDVLFGYDSLVVLVVVVGDILIYLAVEVGAGLGVIHLEVVLFDGSPETLNPGIVRGTAVTVHRDFDPLLLQKEFRA